MAAFELQFQHGARRLLAAAPDRGVLERWLAQRGLSCEIYEATPEAASQTSSDFVLDEYGQPNQPAEALEARWLLELQPWRASPLKTFLQRLAGGLLYLFFASLFATLFVVFPRGQRESSLAPSAFVSILSLAVLGWFMVRATRSGQLDRAAVKLLGVCPALGLGLVVFAALCPLGFSIPHPLQPYAIVRTLDDTGAVKEDEIYRRTAPIVQQLEQAPPAPDAQHVRGYRYSARFGLLLREYLGEGEGKPNMRYECRLPEVLWFTPRVVCETFAFATMNVFPMLPLFALFRHYRDRKQTLAEGLRGAGPPQLSLPHCLWFVAALLVGLMPLASP